jgi:hypothetical protein
LCVEVKIQKCFLLSATLQMLHLNNGGAGRQAGAGWYRIRQANTKICPMQQSWASTSFLLPIGTDTYIAVYIQYGVGY